MKTSAKQPVKNIGANPPTKTVIAGTVCTECWEEWRVGEKPTCDHPREAHAPQEKDVKLNPIPYARRMVHPNGFTPIVSLASGATIRGTVDNPYGNYILQAKLKQGFLPFDECPVGRHVPANGQVPCDGTFSRDECCPHVEAIIRNRRRVYARKQAVKSRQYMSSQDRLVASMEELARQNLSTGKKGKRRDRPLG